MRSTRLGIVLALAIIARTQLANNCPTSAQGACYSVNVPDASASSGNGDIYFQIQGPSSLQWIGLGQGGQNQMRNSNIFIVYADATGSNITLSPRLGVQEVEPQFNSKAQVSLLEGSGIANGKITANVRCSSCTSWGSGTMDLTSSKTPWIWAVKSGNAIKDNSQSADLHQHDIMGNINFDLTVAKGGNSLNPFVAQTDPSATAGAAGTAPTSTLGGGSFQGASSSGGGADLKLINAATIAHGTIMGLAFVLFFPVGAILIRVFSFPGLLWVHAATQLFAYMMAIAGLGLGVYIALHPDRQINVYHPILGLLVVSLLAFQPAFGLTHHFFFKRTSRRTFWTTAHVWLGRALVTLGIINGGLGLRLSGNTKTGEVAYGVVAALVWLVWMAVAVTRDVKGSGRERVGAGEQKRLRSPGESEEGIRRERGGEGVPLEAWEGR